jgi:adenosylcobinamide-phosphate synthase
MSILFAVPFVLLIDRLLGEPRRFHPLVGFGFLAKNIETKLNHGKALFWKGVLSWVLAVIPITICIYLIDQLVGGIWLAIICGWLAIGWQSLRQHGLAVFKAFQKNDLKSARTQTSYLVSRDTSKLDETALSRATIESILENGSDAVIAPLFWLIIFGAPGVILYRLCNTLDAMWGYHNDRYEQFGKFTARIDDILNYIPARISALLYALCGKTKQALKAWKEQGASWYSPNAGVVMATGAGALSLQLGGAANYHGKEKQRPLLGFGKAPTAKDIQSSIHLLDKSIYLLSFFIIVMFLITYFATPPLFATFVNGGS